MRKNIRIYIVPIFILLILLFGINPVTSQQLGYTSKTYLNNPPKIIKSLTYYDKYNDILYITAMDPDNDKICVGIDWDRDQTIDEWSTYRRIQTRWEFECSGKNGLVYIIAMDIHGLKSELYGAYYTTLNINLNNCLLTYLLNNNPNIIYF